MLSQYFVPSITKEGISYSLVLEQQLFKNNIFIKVFQCILTLIWVGFLGVRFEVGWGVKLPTPPGLKLVRIMLETSNLARKYTPKCSFRKYTF